MSVSTKSLLQIIREALESLNSNYGRGSVGSVRLFLNGEGWFEQSIQTTQSTWSKPRKRRFTIHHTAKRITVHALSHQKTIRL